MIKIIMLKLPYLMELFWTFLITSYESEQKPSQTMILQDLRILGTGTRDPLQNLKVEPQDSLQSLKVGPS